MDLKTNEEHMAAFQEYLQIMRGRPVPDTPEYARLLELESAIDAWEAANPPPDLKP